MPIKTQLTGDIQLASFTPFQLPPNTVLAENIADMFSYNLQIPNEPFEIDYLIGSEQIFSFVLSIKNLTENANLTLLLEYNPNIFTIQENSNILLQPKEIKNISVFLNSLYLDAVSRNVTMFEELKVSVTNVASTTVVYRDLATTVLPITTLVTS